MNNHNGAVRLWWRLTLVILLYVAVAVLLRVIPIIILTSILIGDGVTYESANESANVIVFNDSVWSTMIGVLNGFMGILIGYFMVTKIERSKFTWNGVDLDWRKNSPLMIMLGVLMALLLFIAYLCIGYFIGTSTTSMNTLISQVRIASFILSLVLYVAMGFGEEVVFRGYIQTRLVSRYGTIWGILVTAVIFTLLHQISYKLSPIIIFSGTALWLIMGILYYLSKSLYLVGMFHGIMNTLLNTLYFEVTDFEGMVVHVFLLLLILIVLFVRTKQYAHLSRTT